MIKIIGILSLLILIGCKKKPDAPEVSKAYGNGVLVLNEGLFEQNNASISFYRDNTDYQQAFLSENGRGLGDTANDFEAYSLGGKDYIIIAVDISSQIEIVDRYTLKSVAQIPLLNGINAREPRRVEVVGNKAYVCNFDGTLAIIDLVSYTVIDLLEVGANPDGLAVVGDKLFVSNSGGLNFPVYDSTMTVVNTITNAIETTFKTRINSTQMVVDGQNEIYLLSNGNYEDISPALLRIDSETNAVLTEIEMPISSLAYHADWLYFYDENAEAIRRFSTTTEELDPIIVVDVSGFETFRGMQIDSESEHLFCMDANGYVNSSTISAYSLSGGFLYQFQAGLNANTLLFNN